MKSKKFTSLCLSITLGILLISSSVSAQLTGTKTIPGSYATISAAVTALNASSVGAGGVTFNVAANYTETIASTISLTATGTAANPIVFQKDPATTGANPLITAYTGGVGTPATAIQDGLWRFVGCHYVTINGINLRDNPFNNTNPSTMEYGYGLYKASTSVGCQNITIKNCTITLNRINNTAGAGPMTDGSAGIIVLNAKATTATTALVPVAGGTNSNNSFYSDSIQNCNIGISLIGYAAPSPFTLADAGNDIGGGSSATGNTIINYGGATAATTAAAAIRTLAQYGLNVSYNTINNNNGAGVNHPNVLRGIYINAAASATATITNNTITLKGGGTTQAVTGIENASGSTPAANTVTINNNTITNSTYAAATTGGFYGINNSGTPATLVINSNTISNNSNSAGTTGFLYGIYNSGIASAVSIDSNTISGNSTGVLTTGRFYDIYNSAATPNLAINANTISGSATTAATGVHCSIINTGAVTSSININYNNLGTISSPAITFNAANSGTQNIISNTGGTIAAALSISNNNIQGVNYAVAGTGANTYIVNSAATLSQAINNNTFTNLSVNTTGSIIFISDNVVVSSTGTQNINSNSISGTFSKTAAGGTVTLFTSAATSASGAVVNNNSNNFSNITVTGATVIAGWVNTDAGAATKTIQNNTFSNWVGGTSAVTGMAVNITSNNNTVTGNAISAFTSTGAITGITVGTGNNNVYSNTINGLYTTGASVVTGIQITGGTNNKVYKNKIYDLQSNSATGTVNGILVSGTTVVTANVYNNFIGDLKTPSTSAADPVRGISVTATAANSTINIFYNTVYLNASSTGVNFGTSGIYHTSSATATTATLNLRNNIIDNISTPNGTGLTVAYRRSNGTLTNYGTTSNNNIFYAGAPGAKRLIYYDVTNSNQTITLYKAVVSTRDAQSFTEDITSKFLSVSGSSSSFLHLNPTQSTQAESGAINIAGFTDDYDGDVRYGNPGYSGSGIGTDIGADEFNGTAITTLSGSYNVGVGQTYTSLTGAGGLFAAINAQGLSGNLTVNITSDLTEDGTNSLFKWSETGVGNYTVTIQPDAATLRTISGDVVAGMIRFNNASRVTIDGRYSGSGRYLTFRNLNTSGTTGSTFSFINGASNDIIRYCNVEAYTNATTGVILFSTSTIAGGNSNDQVSNNYINATVGGNTGNVAIYSAGTVGKENTANTISNNDIYNYRDRGIDIAATANSWTISGNSLYNGSVSGSINYAAGSTLHGIRILGGYGYSILNNYIGGSATAATGSNATYSSTLGNISFQGILLTTTGASPASYIKGNTITAASLYSVPTAANSNAFIGIESNGSGINIGGTISGDGNTIGSNSTNSAVTVTTSTGTATFTSLIRGINCLSSGGLVIGNQVAGIDISNIGSAAAPSSFIGIYVNNASAPAQVNSNIIGSIAGATSSIRVLSTSTATSTSLTGVYIGAAVVSAIQVNANTIQNLSHLSTSTTVTPGGIIGIRSAATGAASVTITNNTVDSNYIASYTTGVFYGIYNSGICATVSITGNTIAASSIASASGVYYAVYNSAAVTSAININSNNIGTANLPAITFNAANSGAQVFINNGAGAATSALSISNNNIRGVNYSVAGTGSNTYITNSAATLSQAINNNTFTNLSVNTTGNITFISDNVIVSAVGSQNVNSNAISGTFAKTGVGGTITLFTSAASSASGSVINNNSNNFSNITVSGATGIAGWVNTDAGASTKTIQNNTFSNWTGGTSGITGMNINITGTGSTTGNAINNFTSGGNVTGITTGAGNDNIYSNTINTLYSTGASTVTGINITNGTTKKVYRNKIYDLQISNAGGSVNGITIAGGLADSIYNNIIGDLKAPLSSGANMVRGINITSAVANSTIGVYFNTVYLNASSSGTNFGTSGIYHTTSATATTAALDLRNNVITNTSTPNGTGLTVAYRRSSTALTNYASTSNNNLLYSGTPGATKLIFNDGTNSDQTITAFKTRVSTRDALSVTDDLISTFKFLSTTGSSASFLHLDSTKTSLAANSAVNVSGITTDFDQQIRYGNTGYFGTGTAPDMGADEINSTSDLTPPTIVYTPFADTTVITNRNVAGITITDASGINVASGTKPRIYYKRISDANAWAGNTSATNGWKYTEATNSTSPFTFTIDYSILYSGGGSITAGKVQYFIVAQDTAGAPNVAINSGTFAATPSSVALTTAAFPIGGTINGYKITCFTISAGSNTPVCAGGTVSLTATAPSAVSPTYSWSDPTYTIVSGSQNPTVAAIAGTYTVTVTDAGGCVDSATTVVALTTRPTAAISGTTTICNGNSVTLNIAVTGNGTISGTLNNGDVFSGTAPIITINETPAFNTTYTVATLSDSTCTAQPSDITGSAVITVNSGIWTGASNTNWNDSTNWCGGMPGSFTDATIPAGLTNYPVLSASASAFNITIASGASVTIPVNDTLSILGSLNNSGTLTNNGNILLNGSAPQTFPGSAATISAMNNLEVNNTAGVTINQSFSISGTLTSTAGIIDLNGYTITLYSDSVNTAIVAPVYGGFAYTGGGQFTVQRYVPARRSWRLMTSPLTSTNTIFNSWQNGGVYAAGIGTAITAPAGGNGLDRAGNASMYTYGVSTQTFNTLNNTNVNISAGTNGSADNTGYFLFVRGDRNTANFNVPNDNNTTLSSSGKLQTGSQVFNTATVSGNFTLIGNPYASPIDFNNVGLTNLVKRFYTWDPALNTVGGFVVLDDLDGDGIFTSSVGTSPEAKDIQSSQAFFVQTMADGPSSLTINESSKSSVINNLVFRPAAVPSDIRTDLYLLNADNSVTLVDGAYAQFANNFSDNVTLEDAPKLSNINENLSLYRHTKNLAIERRPLISSNDTLYFKLLRTVQRNYRFKVTANYAGPTNLDAVIEDSYTHTSTPLNMNGTTIIDFAVTANAASTNADRFHIVFRPSGVLPVIFTSVNAYPKNEGVNVSWKVSNEINTASYVIEKSTDGKQFSSVATIKATGNSSTAATYDWLDTGPAKGNAYYRIRSVDQNGAIHYSEVVEITAAVGKGIIAVYPSPSVGTIGLQMNQMPKGAYTVHLINNTGQVVLTKAISHSGGTATQQIALNESIAKGNYYLELVNPDKTKTSLKVSIIK